MLLATTTPAGDIGADLILSLRQAQAEAGQQLAQLAVAALLIGAAYWWIVRPRRPL